MSIRILATITVILFTVQHGQAIFDIDSLFPILEPDKLNSLLSVLSPDQLVSLVPILSSENPDANLNFVQLAAKYGHPAEEHIVYTKDGYRLKVFHLPGKGHGLPILLFHGFSDSADTWIIRGNKSLAITLANAGYDVWLGNVRGNKHSQGHIPLSLAANSTYWNFTFHEHAVYDLPTTIDYVLNKTGASKLNSIGHSQGTTIHFVLLSSKPEYNEKVNLVINLAPVVYFNHSPPTLALFLRSLPEIYKSSKASHRYEMFGDSSPEEAFIRTACSTAITAYTVCLLGVLYKLTGYDVTQIEPDFSVVAFRHSPTAASTKNALHFSQVATRKRFAQFDYGTEGNLIAYNSAEPPTYKLENVKSKTVLLTAKNDFFSTQADVALLRPRLPNIVRFVVIPRAEMNHLDYIWGADMTSYLFPYIFDSLKMYGSE